MTDKAKIEQAFAELEQNIDSDDIELYTEPLADLLNEAENKASYAEQVFLFMEKYDTAYLGAPGALVRFVESVDGYEDILIPSLKRHPSYYPVWMLNRLANSRKTRSEIESYCEILGNIASNENIKKTIRSDAASFLEYQNERLKKINN